MRPSLSRPHEFLHCPRAVNLPPSVMGSQTSGVFMWLGLISEGAHTSRAHAAVNPENQWNSVPILHIPFFLLPPSPVDQWRATDNREPTSAVWER